ncbi:hypothetical protein HMI55_000241 [Coelomomyces lativittatus]|nr:hypothetical protein HMI56_000356 [Coelomomyces lativittatus]KAJ1508765.1 hypothetical protein HMI55_000241 [Coelomomyces lativittatus]
MTISPVYSTMDSESNKSPIRLTTTNSSTGGTSSLSGESIENGSILHLRLSFSSNGIQLLPPYLERPLNLSSENSDYSLPDIQSFLSVLSNLSTPVRSSSISQSLPSFNHLPPSTTNNTSSTSSTSSSHLNGHTPLSTSISSSSSSSSSSSTSPSLISEKKRPSHLRSSSLSLERIPEPSSPLKKHREVSPSTLENTLSSCHRAKRIRSASSHQLETSKKKEMEEKSSRKEEKQVGITYMNLPFHAKKDELKAFFESCGPVKQYQFMLGNNRSFRGIAHVTYETPESATKALKLNNTVFRGREVSVCYTDFSLLPRNPHSQSKELPSLLNSRSKRSRSDHYYSSTTATRSASQKASTVLLENLPMGLTLDQIHDEACKNGNVVKVDWANRSKT